MMLDRHNEVTYKAGINPVAAVTNNTAYVSAIIDTQGYSACEFVGIFGAIADADVTFTVLFEDGNDSGLSDNAAVDDAYLLGIEAMGLQYDSDNKTFKIGYIGPKRYCRVTVTPANNTGNVFLAAVWALGKSRKSPKTAQVV